MRLLTYSSLYPNAAQPNHGVFVENRLRHLVSSGAAQSRVVAPVPWFPSSHPAFGSYAAFAAAPRREERHGLSIEHPRYPVIPKIGMSWTPQLMYRFTFAEVARLRASGYDFDAIDAHYFYPDGVAAALIARRLGKPVVITARGTDINLIPAHARPRQQILWAATQAARIITVCEALRRSVIELGVPGDKVVTLRNGVDLETFRPMPRDEARREFAFERPTLLSVGGLIPRKANEIMVAALPELPGFEFVLIGDGPDRGALEAQSRKLGVADRVRFLGRIAHADLPRYYSAADALILASSREGWANVLLEAMACGTPVVASNVWGTPEVVAAPEAGVLMPERTPQGMVAAVKQLFTALPDRTATRLYAEGFDWQETTQGQIDVFSGVIDEHCGAPGERSASRSVKATSASMGTHETTRTATNQAE